MNTFLRDTMTNQNETKSRLERVLSLVAQTPVEIVIRGELDFTAIFSGDSETPERFLNRYFRTSGKLVFWKPEYDSEFDETFIFFTVSE
jgi:hypothetical protein